MNKTRTKRIGTALCLLFALGTLVAMVILKRYDRLLMAVGTVLLVCLPAAMERFFRCRLCLPVYLFGLAYALGPMLGQCWNLYYTTIWWDKLLHMSGGVMFAIVGVFLMESLLRDRKKWEVCVLFGLFFSIALSAIWEFVEFGADQLLGMDMQHDTLITAIHSYMLGDGVGVRGSITDIQSTLVNGSLMPGYMDIGLIDTMMDMMLESLGALVTCVLLWLDRGKHPLIRVNEPKEEVTL